MAKKSDYFGLGRLISLILAIIPFTSWICGVLTRLQERRYIAAIIRLIFGWNVIYVLDLIFMIFTKKIFPIL